MQCEVDRGVEGLGKTAVGRNCKIRAILSTSFGCEIARLEGRDAAKCARCDRLVMERSFFRYGRCRSELLVCPITNILYSSSRSEYPVRLGCYALLASEGRIGR